MSCTYENASRTTLENAWFTAELLASPILTNTSLDSPRTANPLASWATSDSRHRVLVVSSSYHLARCLVYFRRYFEIVDVVGARDRKRERVQRCVCTHLCGHVYRHAIAPRSSMLSVLATVQPIQLSCDRNVYRHLRHVYTRLHTCLCTSHRAREEVCQWQKTYDGLWWDTDSFCLRSQIAHATYMLQHACTVPVT